LPAVASSVNAADDANPVHARPARPWLTTKGTVMTDYRLGQRVALTRTHELDNSPHVGQQGTVLAYDRAAQRVSVSWDDGTVTDVRLTDGDRLKILSASAPISDEVWRQLLVTVTARGAHDGHQAADVWSREQAGRSLEQVRGIARQILQALDDDEDLDQSEAPQYDTSRFARPPISRQVSQLLAAGGVTEQPVPQARCRQADWSYRDAF
jgi:hypothetical protein